MGVIKADQPRAIRGMQGKRVRQAMWPFLSDSHALDFEFEPVTFVEVMNTAVKGKQELEAMIWRRATEDIMPAFAEAPLALAQV